MNKWGIQMKGTIDLSYMNNILTETQMMQIGLAALSVIQTETQDKHVDKNGKRFKKYSSSYAQFRKEEGRGIAVDLTFTGKMLNALSVIKATDSSVKIGFIDSTPARGGLRPSQKMMLTNKTRPWFGFGGANSKRRNKIYQIGSEIFIEALTRRVVGSN